MFLGTYDATVIGRNRLAMPAKIRKEIEGKRVVLTVGFEECIFGFRENDWEVVVKPELSDQLRITVIATGFDESRRRLQEMVEKQDDTQSTQMYGSSTPVAPVVNNSNANDDEEESIFDIPAFLRQKN